MITLYHYDTTTFHMEGTEGTDSLSFNSLSEVIDAMFAAGCNNLVRITALQYVGGPLPQCCYIMVFIIPKHFKYLV